jgi:hypothetical protein
MNTEEKMKEVRSLLNEIEDMVRERLVINEGLESYEESSFELIESALLAYSFIMSNANRSED